MAVYGRDFRAYIRRKQESKSNNIMEENETMQCRMALQRVLCFTPDYIERERTM